MINRHDTMMNKPNEQNLSQTTMKHRFVIQTRRLIVMEENKFVFFYFTEIKRVPYESITEF